VSNAQDRPSPAPAKKRNERIVVDGHYVREQASEAAAIFLAPVSGIFRVLVGSKVRKGDRKRAA
jgi:hypothetical protein